MPIRDTKTHILEAAIMTIERHGIQHVTTRLIADAAGVNNAALHYYYGTKEQLVEAALAQSVRHMGEDLEAILAKPFSVREGLHEALTYLVGGAVRYPNIVRAHFLAPISGTGAPSPGAAQFETHVCRLRAYILARKPELAQAHVAASLHTAISACLLTAMAPDVLAEKAGIRLDDPVSRDAYIRFQVDMILGEA